MIAKRESTKWNWGFPLLKSGVAISKKCSPQAAREKIRILRSYERVRHRDTRFSGLYLVRDQLPTNREDQDRVVQERKHKSELRIEFAEEWNCDIEEVFVTIGAREAKDRKVV